VPHPMDTRPTAFSVRAFQMGPPLSPCGAAARHFHLPSPAALGFGPEQPPSDPALHAAVSARPTKGRTDPCPHNTSHRRQSLRIAVEDIPRDDVWVYSYRLGVGHSLLAR
jgi:hypothetical protein